MSGLRRALGLRHRVPVKDDVPWWLEQWFDMPVVWTRLVRSGDRWVEQREVAKREKDARERGCDSLSHPSARRNR